MMMFKCLGGFVGVLVMALGVPAVVSAGTGIQPASPLPTTAIPTDKPVAGNKVEAARSILDKTPKSAMPLKSAADLGAQPAAGSLQTPAEKGPGAVVLERENCGTFWTGWVDDPNADVNPCPKNCTRGERQVLDQSQNGDATRYKARYACYLPEMVINQKPAVARALDTGGVKGTNCGTFWTGWVDDPNGDANPCPQNCERGELNFAKRNATQDTMKYDLNFRCYQAGTTNLAAGGSPKAAAENLGDQPAAASVTKPSPAAPVSTTGPASGKPQVPAGGFVPQPTSSPIPAPRTAASMRQPGPSEMDPGFRLPSSTPSETAGAGTSSDSASVAPVSGAPKGAQVAGTSTTASAKAALGTDMPQLKSLPGSNREISTEKLEGEGTTITEITDVMPTSMKVSWLSKPGATAYQAHASAKGLNHIIDGEDIPAGAAGVQTISDVLQGLAPGVEYNAWVTVKYPNGQQGSSDMKIQETAAGINPQDVQVTALGPNAVRVEWHPVEGAIEYRIEGDNLPAMKTTNTAVAVSNLAEGEHHWTLITVYALGMMYDLNPTNVTARIDGRGNVDTNERGHYRISILGFRVNEATSDDPLEGDGKGDEVYVAAAVGKYSLPDGNLVQRFPIIPSPVFGDKNGYENANRVLAGGASVGGGLQSGNVYPNPDPVNSGRAVTIIDLPYLIWEGDLVAGKDALVVTPSIWEWDNNSTTYYYTWTHATDPNFNTLLPGDLSDPDIQAALNGERLSTVFKKNKLVGFKMIIYTHAAWFEGPGGDVMVGNVDCGNSPYNSHEDWACFNQVWVPLTKELIDKELAMGGSGVLPAGVMDINFDNNTVWVYLAGNYTMYLKVERLP